MTDGCEQANFESELPQHNPAAETIPLPREVEERVSKLQGTLDGRFRPLEERGVVEPDDGQRRRRILAILAKRSRR